MPKLIWVYAVSCRSNQSNKSIWWSEPCISWIILVLKIFSEVSITCLNHDYLSILISWLIAIMIRIIIIIETVFLGEYFQERKTILVQGLWTNGAVWRKGSDSWNSKWILKFYRRTGLLNARSDYSIVVSQRLMPRLLENHIIELDHHPPLATDFVNKGQSTPMYIVFTMMIYTSIVIVNKALNSIAGCLSWMFYWIFWRPAREQGITAFDAACGWLLQVISDTAVACLPTTPSLRISILEHTR